MLPGLNVKSIVSPEGFSGSLPNKNKHPRARAIPVYFRQSKGQTSAFHTPLSNNHRQNMLIKSIEQYVLISTFYEKKHV